VVEYTGEVIRGLAMEERMTICNMTIEAGARAGLVAPDDTTLEYLAGRPFAPQGRDWERAVSGWRQLPTDEGAVYDRTVALNVSRLEPMITFGTNPSTAVAVTSRVPDPAAAANAAQRQALEKALAYMNLRPGQPLLGHPVDVVFIGSCTNGRLSDLRLAASVLQGRRVSPGTRLLVVPGSQQVRRQAEEEGLARIFREAGAEWREPGCSMCIGMNGDTIQPGQYSVSTSNRNFEGRQGKGGRTMLASPLTAAASAVNGAISDVRRLL
jgi:3-isopropylmalate/(R)-2-methylmalate dehydratase large subunit